MKANSKKKNKRRTRGKTWVAKYHGEDIIQAYKREFKIQLITAINDLEAIGVSLDSVKVVEIKINRHSRGEHISSKTELNRLNGIVQDEYDNEWTLSDKEYFF